MNNMKRIISILIFVGCLVLTCSFVVSATVVPRVTFTNAEKNTPDLYVTKIVTNASEDVQDDEDPDFVFVVTVDEKIYKDEIYILLDASGKEVIKTDPNGNKVPYKTDSKNGRFKLKAGQTAVFENVGSGKAYEVEEFLKSDDYIQVKPASGSVVGTVKPKGSSVEFENLYNPIKEDPTVTTTTLVVRNIISFPDGYTPWQEEGVFTFSADIDYNEKALAKKEYTVTKADGSEETRTANADGTFTLKGGETATFEEVTANVDYAVAELEDRIPAGWNLIKADNTKGLMKTPVTYVTFTNLSASFGVSKSMEDGTRHDHTFNFELKDGNGNAWGGQQYYLYQYHSKNDSWDLTSDERYETSADGVFQLQTEQTAIFIGIEPDTPYSVKEIITEEDGYEQVMPTSEDGYTKTVHKSVEVLEFVNKQKPTKRALTVTKQVENMTNIPPNEMDTFPFRLLRNMAGTGEKADYQPVKDIDFVIESGTEIITGQVTDDKGIFFICADETARFTTLSPGVYKVEEVTEGEDWDDRYTAKGDTEQIGVLPENDELSFTFVNQYWYVPPTGIKALSTVWKILIGVVIAILLAFAAIILIRRRKRRFVESKK